VLPFSTITTRPSGAPVFDERLHHLYELRYRSVDIADRLELPDRIVVEAIRVIRSREYRKVIGKKARRGLFDRNNSGDSGQ
jgi:hypothetical protein